MCVRSWPLRVYIIYCYTVPFVKLLRTCILCKYIIWNNVEFEKARNIIVKSQTGLHCFAVALLKFLLILEKYGSHANDGSPLLTRESPSYSWEMSQNNILVKSMESMRKFSSCIGCLLETKEIRNKNEVFACYAVSSPRNLC